MKLLVIATIKEQVPDVSKLLKKASVPVFSVLDAIGVKNMVDEDMTDDWFGRGVGEFESAFIVSFTTANLADQVLGQITELNQTLGSAYPVRAFVLSVDKSLN
ncbi:MAG: hypothetical protein RL185_622 [Bacteroidota bacterium]